MKKLLFLFVFTMSALDIARAQAPEFSMRVKFFRGASTSANKTVVFGYDPTASDALEDIGKKPPAVDNWYPDLGGENLAPPAGFDWDFRLSGAYIGRFSDLQGGSYVDIRRKPDGSSFRQQFEIDMVENDSTSVRLEWDNGSIPAIVHHITLASNQDTAHPLLDMTTTSSFTFSPRSVIEHYGSMILNLYYNSDPADVPVSTFPSSKELRIYPNPMDSRSRLHFVANEDSRLTLSGYDITGKKVFERVVNAFAGDNSIDIGKEAFSSHSGVYLLRLNGVEGARSFEKSTTIIVR